jgi:hypothetical protein
MRRTTALVSLLLAASACAAQDRSPALDAIREDDLLADLIALSSDAMRGREAGTRDELGAGVWLAKRAAAAGLEPAGDDGTFFQFWPIQRTRVSTASTFTVGGTPLPYLDGVFVVQPVDADVSGTVRWIGDAAPGAAGSAAGAVLVADVLPPPEVPDDSVSLWGYRYTLGAIRARAGALAEMRPAAIILVSDSVAETQIGFVGQRSFARGQYAIDRPETPDGPPTLWVSHRYRDRLRAANGQRFTAHIQVERFTYPSVNVVAQVPGRDPALEGEYVLFSGHIDHDGIIVPVDGDSIWNGADDNGSVDVALLAIGRAFVQRPGRRSVLFVWHGAEEKGLLGSRWFAAHPTVPLDSIVAVLNGDMIGRNAPDQAALLGAQPPHLNSPELVAWALEANDSLTHFTVDTLWDRPSHPEHWYFRSDHLSYARLGVPAIFFSTLLHADYHTPRDEADLIDYSKLTRMTQWMYATGWRVATADHRPGVLEEFHLER